MPEDIVRSTFNDSYSIEAKLKAPKGNPADGCDDLDLGSYVTIPMNSHMTHTRASPARRPSLHVYHEADIFSSPRGV
jgi:hypothetical protein